MGARISRFIIRIASMLVPSDARAEWREEWEAEVWHASSAGGAGGRRGAILVVRSLGAFRHALSLRAVSMKPFDAVHELKLAVRSLRRHPGFAVMAVATLALGIGGTTTLFSIVNGVLLRPLPLRAPERLVWMWGSFSRGNVASVSPPDFVDYREGMRSFSDLAAMTSFVSTAILGGVEGPQEMRRVSVSSSFFRVLGVEPLSGRAFTEEETAGGESDLVMLAEPLWRRRYGADPAIVGQAILVDGQSRTVVGIVPSDHVFPANTDLWTPLTFGNEDFSVRGAHFLRPIGRLREGVTLAQAQADMDAIAQRLEAAYPQSNTTWRLRLVPLQTAIIGSYRMPLFTLLGAVGLVLIVACANVAGLLLARATTRRGEMAVRSALGASRRRLLRQLMLESLTVAMLAGVTGIVLAKVLLAVILRIDAIGIPRLDETTLDPGVLGFALVLSIVTGHAFGLAPAWQLAAGRLGGVIRETGRDAGAGGRARSVLVVAEIALAVVLMAGASLLIRSFDALRSESPGFEVEDGLVARLRFPAGRYPDGAAVTRTMDAVLDRLRSLPGIEAAGAINALPIVESEGDTRLYAASRPPADPNDWQGAFVRVVSDGYFEAMGIPLLRGSTGDRSDGPGSPAGVVINEALGRSLFRGDDPIGEVVMVGVGEPVPMSVIGVVGSVRQHGFDLPPSPEFYMFQRQMSWAVARMTIIVRTRGHPAGLVPAVRDAIRAIDADQTLSVLQPLDDLLAGTIAQPRFRTALLTAFAAIALFLCSLGVYGILAFNVTRRTREIGIRIALGEETARVIRSIIVQGLWLVVAGLSIGLAAAIAATRLLAGMLYGVEPGDPRSFVITALTIIAVAVLASVVPAARAARIDPARALRTE